MVSLQRARAQLLAALPPPRVETVALWEAWGRVLAEDVHAREDIPGFDRAAMDGYAVRAADVAGASGTRPACLRLAGAVMAGGASLPAVQPGSAVAVATGAPMPPGADAVVPCERAREEADHVIVFGAVRPGDNAELAGEDLRAGSLALPRGTLLRPQEIGLLAEVGVDPVPVVAAPRVALIPTGDELVEVTATPGPGQVRESTARALAAAFRQCGAHPHLRARVPDRLDALVTALEQTLPGADLIVTTGGASVGRRDLLREAIRAVGAQLLYWRVAIKPGKNIAVARWRHAVLIGLSGRPASALTTFDLVVRPAVATLSGRPRTRLARVWVRLDHEIPRLGGLTRLLRARVWREGDGFRARLAGSQLASVLSSLREANAYVVVPPGRSAVPAGQPLEALVMEGAEAHLLDEEAAAPAPAGAAQDGRLAGGTEALGEARETAAQRRGDGRP